MAVMFPAIPGDVGAIVSWIDAFGDDLNETFTKGFRFDPAASGSDAIVFSKTTDAPVFLVPKPPPPVFFTGAFKSGDAYATWVKCFAPLLAVLRNTEFLYQPPPAAPPRLFTTPRPTTPSDLLPFYERYYVFASEPYNKNKHACPVCLESGGDSGRIICGKGHWLCGGCTERLYDQVRLYDVDDVDDDVVERPPPCPVCRTPATATTAEGLAVVRF